MVLGVILRSVDRKTCLCRAERPPTEMMIMADFGRRYPKSAVAPVLIGRVLCHPPRLVGDRAPTLCLEDLNR